MRVLPTQSANAYVSERIIEFQDAYTHADALAIAPHVSFNVPWKRTGSDPLPASLPGGLWSRC